MYVHTAPREIAARWIQAGDEIAMYEVEDGSGEADSGLRNFCRTEEFVSRYSSPDWWLVVDGARLVRPPADEDGPARPVDGWWNVQPAIDRGFVPEDLDHVGASSFVMAPIVSGRLAEPRIYFAKDSEQFVIRERVQIGPHVNLSRRPRLLTPREQTEGQRIRVGSTVAEIDLNAPAPRVLVAASGVEIDTPVMLGVPIGREVLESDAVNFRSERDSDPDPA